MSSSSFRVLAPKSRHNGGNKYSSVACHDDYDDDEAVGGEYEYDDIDDDDGGRLRCIREDEDESDGTPPQTTYVQFVPSIKAPNGMTLRGANNVRKHSIVDMDEEDGNDNDIDNDNDNDNDKSCYSEEDSEVCRITEGAAVPIPVLIEAEDEIYASAAAQRSKQDDADQQQQLPSTPVTPDSKLGLFGFLCAAGAELAGNTSCPGIQANQGAAESKMPSSNFHGTVWQRLGCVPSEQEFASPSKAVNAMEDADVDPNSNGITITKIPRSNRRRKAAFRDPYSTPDTTILATPEPSFDAGADRKKEAADSNNWDWDCLKDHLRRHKRFKPKAMNSPSETRKSKAPTESKVMQYIHNTTKELEGKEPVHAKETETTGMAPDDEDALIVKEDGNKTDGTDSTASASQDTPPNHPDDEGGFEFVEKETSALMDELEAIMSSIHAKEQEASASSSTLNMVVESDDEAEAECAFVGVASSKLIEGAQADLSRSLADEPSDDEEDEDEMPEGVSVPLQHPEKCPLVLRRGRSGSSSQFLNKLEARVSRQNEFKPVLLKDESRAVQKAECVATVVPKCMKVVLSKDRDVPVIVPSTPKPSKSPKKQSKNSKKAVKTLSNEIYQIPENGKPDFSPIKQLHISPKKKSKKTTDGRSPKKISSPFMRLIKQFQNHKEDKLRPNPASSSASVSDMSADDMTVTDKASSFSSRSTASPSLKNSPSPNPSKSSSATAPLSWLSKKRLGRKEKMASSSEQVLKTPTTTVVTPKSKSYSSKSSAKVSYGTARRTSSKATGDVQASEQTPFVTPSRNSEKKPKKSPSSSNLFTFKRKSLSSRKQKIGTPVASKDDSFKFDIDQANQSSFSSSVDISSAMTNLNISSPNESWAVNTSKRANLSEEWDTPAKSGGFGCDDVDPDDDSGSPIQLCTPKKIHFSDSIAPSPGTNLLGTEEMEGEFPSECNSGADEPRTLLDGLEPFPSDLAWNSPLRADMDADEFNQAWHSQGFPDWDAQVQS